MPHLPPLRHAPPPRRTVPLVLSCEEHAQRLLLAVLADPPAGLGEAEVITGLAVVSSCLNAAYGAPRGIEGVNRAGRCEGGG